MELTLVTSNNHKVKEYERLLGVQLSTVSLDLDELQATGKEIIRHKALQAYSHVQKPVIVDDAGLFVHAWKELPGVYVKHFLENVGNTGIYRMLADFPDKRAVAACWIGYCDSSSHVEVFVGEVTGSIVAPRGLHNFGGKGWDAIFLPEGSLKTFGEMTPLEKSADSHRVRAVLKLKEFLLQQK